MNCLFCSIAKKELNSSIVYETENVIAFDDIAKQAPVHVVIIPKDHITELDAVGSVLKDIFKAVWEVSKVKNVNESGFRVIMNKGRDAGQAIEHMHFHLLGGRSLKWPPG